MTEEMLKLARKFYGYGPQAATDPELEDDVERLAALLTAEIRKARLEEAKWWHDLIVVDSGDELDEHDCSTSGWAECDRFRSLGGTTK